jgi:hypothetical protein
MENNFNNREFEQYVKRNADQYRMIPSEKVWKGINSSLHTRKKWYGLGLSLVLLLTAVSVTWVMVSYPVSKKQAITSAEKASLAAQTQSVNPNQPSPGSPADNSKSLLSFNRFNKQDNDDQVLDKLNVEPVNDPAKENTTSLLITDTRISEQDLLPTDRFHKNITEKKDIPGFTNSITVPEAAIIVTDEKISMAGPGILPEKKSERPALVYYPITIESVVNAFQPQKISKKLTWQLYFTPTVSYRKLSQNKSFENSAAPFRAASYPFASLSDVNSAVVHKPDLGLELGLSARYPLSKNLKISGGLQFNINRYDIKAFVYTGEPATINLSGGNGNNSVTAWTYYRNYNGYKSDWLKNFYFSVSAPVGAELKLFGNQRTNFGIAGTIQPTYILRDRAYLISTDYKNYAEVPWLVRHVNVNTSLETFLSYTNHRTKWQVGPQIRYQVLSSFQNKYPVKENLFDYGLKIGITLNQ